MTIAKKEIDTKNAFKNEYIAKNGGMAREYFCNKDCFFDNKVKKEFILRMERLLLLKENGSKTFMYKSIDRLSEDYNYEVLNEYIKKEQFNLKRTITSKDFSTEFAKVKYVFVVIESQLKVRGIKWI